MHCNAFPPGHARSLQHSPDFLAGLKKKTWRKGMEGIGLEARKRKGRERGERNY